MKTFEEILVYLKSDEPDKRALGVMIVGKQRLFSGLGWVVRALSDEHSEVRERAAWALDMLNSPITVPALLEALYDPVFGVRSNAAWALVHIAQRTIPHVVVPEVIDVLCDQGCYNARQMAYLILYHIGDETSREAIRLYWRD